MKLHPPLRRDPTEASIGSRELSDPHAYSMIYPPMPSHSSSIEEEDDLWPLKPGPAIKKPSVDRSSGRSSVSHRRRPSSAPSSLTQVGSPEAYTSLGGDTPVISDEEPFGKKESNYQELTALPTIDTKPGPLGIVVGAVQGTIRNLQEVPAQQSSVKGNDAEGQPIVVFTPGKGVYMAFGVLANLTIMVALDSTALSVALPVSSILRQAGSG